MKNGHYLQRRREAAESQSSIKKTNEKSNCRMPNTSCALSSCSSSLGGLLTGFPVTVFRARREEEREEESLVGGERERGELEGGSFNEGKREEEVH